jgi:hypothetical protein
VPGLERLTFSDVKLLCLQTDLMSMEQNVDNTMGIPVKQTSVTKGHGHGHLSVLTEGLRLRPSR